MRVKMELWTLTSYGPYTILSDKLRPPTQISVTSYGPPTQNSVTSYGPPTLISVTIGTRILKLKLKIRVKMKFFRLFTMFIVILRSFYIIYVEISCHLIVPLKYLRTFECFRKLNKPSEEAHKKNSKICPK